VLPMPSMDRPGIEGDARGDILLFPTLDHGRRAVVAKVAKNGRDFLCAGEKLSVPVSRMFARPAGKWDIQLSPSANVELARFRLSCQARRPRRLGGRRK
jgi:hypothetical protein